MNLNSSASKTLLAIAFILLNILLLLLISLFLMDYDDNYNTSKGAYWSLGSMNNFQKAIYIAYSLWWLINSLFVVVLGYKVYRYYFKKTTNSSAR